MKLKGSNGKKILKALLEKYLEPNLFTRPKMGFGVPIASWLREPLKDWSTDLLNEKDLNEQGFFDSKVVHKYLKEHQDGTFNWQNQIWTLLMFQCWYNKNI